MVAKNRRIEARRRARELQKADAERLARMQSARTDAFVALETLDAVLIELGTALDQLVDEGEKKSKLAQDFTVSLSRINEALDMAGSAYAPGNDADSDEKSREDRSEDLISNDDDSNSGNSEENESNDAASIGDS